MSFIKVPENTLPYRKSFTIEPMGKDINPVEPIVFKSKKVHNQGMLVQKKGASRGVEQKTKMPSSKNKTIQRDIFSSVNIGKITIAMSAVSLCSQHHIFASALLGIAGLFTYGIGKEIEKHTLKMHRT
ncbi:MAG: hypothetical protein ACJARD_000222 [Alphaproteobacteria bacterium]|jgi:hypothetical protein